MIMPPCWPSHCLRHYNHYNLLHTSNRFGQTKIFTDETCGHNYLLLHSASASKIPTISGSQGILPLPLSTLCFQDFSFIGLNDYGKEVEVAQFNR